MNITRHETDSLLFTRSTKICSNTAASKEATDWCQENTQKKLQEAEVLCAEL